jgi:putative restriction endonuclease
MISQPLFFARDDWVADHAAWHPRIQGDKTIDVLHGDRQRILAECSERAARLRRAAEPRVDELRRYGAPQPVQLRLGQGTFRIAVTNAYGACAAQRAAAPFRHPLPRAMLATSPSHPTTASA